MRICCLLLANVIVLMAMTVAFATEDAATSPVEPALVIKHVRSVKTVTFGLGAKRIFSSDADGVHVHETATGKEIAFFKFDDPSNFPEVGTLLLSPDQKLIAGGGTTDQINLLDSVTGKKVKSLSLATNPSRIRLAWSPEGKKLASAITGKIQIWDVESGKVTAEWSGPDGMNASVGFSPDGSKLLGISMLTLDSGVIYIWDATTGRQISKIFTPGGNHEWACFLDEKTIISPATGNAGGAVAIDIDTSKPKYTFKAGTFFTDTFNAGALSHDRKRLVTGDTGQTDAALVQIWDATTGHLQATLKGHESNFIYSVAFSPDDSMIASACGDQKVCLWSTPKP